MVIATDTPVPADVDRADRLAARRRVRSARAIDLAASNGAQSLGGAQAVGFGGVGVDIAAVGAACARSCAPPGTW